MTVMLDQVYRVVGGKLFIAESAQALDRATDGSTFTVTQELLIQKDEGSGAQQGCYRVNSGSLSLDAAGRSSTMQYTLGGTTLTLRSADGKPSSYRRAEPWYPRERLDYQPPKRER